MFKVTRDNSKEIVTSDFIKGLRKKIDMSETVLASVIGVGYGTVKGWENNDLIPTLPEKKLLYLIDKQPNIVDYLYKIDKGGKL